MPLSTNPTFVASQLNQNGSSNDDFKSARESLSPSVDEDASAGNLSPGSKRNPIRLVDYSDSDKDPLSFDSSEEDKSTNEIPLPPTRSEDGHVLRFKGLNAGFEYVQTFTRQNGFAVKKAQKKGPKDHPITQYINYVRGGPTHNTKVAPINRKRSSRSLIMEQPCRFRASLKRDRDSHDLWTLSIINGSHTHGPAERSSVFAIHRRNARKAEPAITQHINAH